MTRVVAQAVMSRINCAEAMIPAMAADALMSDLQELANNPDQDKLEEMSVAARPNLLMAYGFGGDMPSPSKKFAYADGVAIIPVHGTLINRFYGSWGFITGYNRIRSDFNAALDDEDVKLIVFDHNSYGGEAAGCFELADEIREARSRKPLLAVVDSNSCSAAYALASAASRVVVTPSGQVGSVGVIAMHMNIGKMLKNNGVEVTIIAEGAHKADGNPYEALSPEVLKEIRASVSKRYGEFVDLVVKNRSKLDSAAVKATESRSYRADEALALKLIDAVQTPTEAVSRFLAEIGSDDYAEDEEDEKLMTEDEIKAANEQAAATARAEEKARVSGILGCDEAKSRPALAKQLAIGTSMSVDEARPVLAAAAVETKEEPKEAPKEEPKEEPKDEAKGAGAFEKAMKGGNPEVGADGNLGGEDGEAPKLTRAERAMANAGMDMSAHKKAAVTAH